ncbi:ISL3 family transposase [Sporosarcina obsidiansis]|uniref:ISL3 family transposase n=1 Tax=Sporosarcina obsidiansis TaxID=2660748 RepID=UPI001E33E301|nr:ISL3 family transposase [Sporosarcina obsidiansis]
MHSHSIKNLWDLPQLNIVTTEKVEQQIFIEVLPIEHKQPCPICNSCQKIRRGIGYTRKVRHLDAFGCQVYLKLPAIRLSCKDSTTSIVCDYSFVAPKKRYTKAFEAILPKQAIRSTITHTARVTETPASTVTRVVRAWKKVAVLQVQQACQQKALNCPNLVLGIDDFAIRKGHTYNTGLHDLRNGTFLDVIKGRTINELETYFHTQYSLCALKPRAIVMDLAKAYHTFAKSMYPEAIRIADRFHVNRYVTEALQTIRRSVQKDVAPFAKKDLKQHFRILGKRNDQLSVEERAVLERLLQYAPILRRVYEWKEMFIDWYDCSSSYRRAKKGYQCWLKKGEAINHPTVQNCLKTMYNWRDEICNYHQLRFTNAAVEGKNNLIKALQHRHFFTRNPEHYKESILLECNMEWIQYY